jgi:hypothetical protein
MVCSFFVKLAFVARNAKTRYDVAMTAKLPYYPLLPIIVILMLLERDGWEDFLHDDIKHHKGNLIRQSRTEYTFFAI